MATVGKARITAAELEQAVGSLEKTYRDVYGSAFTREMARALDLRQQARQGVVQLVGVLHATRREQARQQRVQTALLQCPDGTWRDVSGDDSHRLASVSPTGVGRRQRAARRCQTLPLWP